MADTAEVKFDETKAEVAAEKAFAAALEAVEVKPAAPAKVAAKPVVKPAPVVKQAPATPKARVAKKVPAAKAPKPAAKVAAKKSVKPAAKKIATKKTVKAAAAKPPVAKIPTIAKLKDTIMTKTKTTTEDFTAKIQTAVADAQDKAKAAFEKSQAALGEYGEFTKGNVEAIVASGKILAAGLQDLGRAYVADGKSVLETVTADVKDLAGVKSPADFFKLQGEILRRNFDAAVATGSKSSETIVKLASEAFAPISTRVSLAVEKVKLAA